MRKHLVAAVAAVALTLVGTGAAALSPSVYDPGHTGCVTATFSRGVLHLAKTCPTPTNAEAGADITGVTGQQFTSASFTLASASQCNGGSPRFTIQMTSGTIFFLGCNNVTPTINPDGTATYTFTAATLAAAGQQVPFPTGTIQAVDVALDVQGSADITRIFFNGIRELPAGTGPLSKSECKNGGWRTFTDPRFKNQGQCVAWFNHHNGKGKGNDDSKSSKGKKGDDDKKGDQGKKKGHGR
jgi:hypothetical protein